MIVFCARPEFEQLVVADAEMRAQLLRFQELTTRAHGPEAAANEIIACRRLREQR